MMEESFPALTEIVQARFTSRKNNLRFNDSFIGSQLHNTFSSAQVTI
jgi:hypothetical protein